jgi:hypothetical protein
MKVLSPERTCWLKFDQFLEAFISLSPSLRSSRSDLRFVELQIRPCPVPDALRQQF